LFEPGWVGFCSKPNSGIWPDVEGSVACDDAKHCTVIQNVKIAIVELRFSWRDEANLRVFMMRTREVLAALRRYMANDLL